MKNVITVIVILLSPFFFAVTCKAEDTLHYDVVTEYIRSLGAIHNIQLLAATEIQNDGDTPISKLMAGIRSSTRVKLELNASISALKSMTLKKPFDTLLPTTIECYKAKIELHNEVIRISKTFLSAPKPGIDYSEMVAIMPEITATIECTGNNSWGQNRGKIG